MAQKKSKKKKPQPAQPLVRLSQVMIVKNEEKNIETALGWAKGIAFEQIVVDTGSTDRTVELAEKMGAKICHFEWVNDFSAAKNFAIEQASGNWIAFLDADEYFSKEDAKKMMGHIKKIQADPIRRANWFVLHCPWLQMDDAGNTAAVNEQGRVFRNLPSIRYVGRIHESLSVSQENTVLADDIAIVHTGYTEAAYTETQKLDRNIKLLREELKARPDDLNMKGYLADSLKSKGDKESLAETGALFREILADGAEVLPALRKRAYMFLMTLPEESEKDLAEREGMSLAAQKEFPGDIDFEYYHAVVLNKMGRYREAMEILKSCETKLLGTIAHTESETVAVNPIILFWQMMAAANGLGDIQGVVRAATMTLTVDKTQEDVLSSYITALLKNDISEEEVVQLLSKVYDMGDQKDLLFIARAAKNCNAIAFARYIIKIAGQK